MTQQSDGEQFMYHELFLEREVPSRLTEAVVPMTCTWEVLRNSTERL